MMEILVVSLFSASIRCRLSVQHNLAKQHSINSFCSHSISFPLFSFNNFSLSTFIARRGRMAALLRVFHFFSLICVNLVVQFVTWISSVGFSMVSFSTMLISTVDIFATVLKFRSYSAFSNIMRSLYSDLVTISWTKQKNAKIDFILWKNRVQLIDYLLQQLLNDGNTWFTLEAAVAKQFHNLSDGVRERFTLFVIPIDYIDFFLTPHVITAGKLFYWLCLWV